MAKVAIDARRARGRAANYHLAHWARDLVAVAVRMGWLVRPDTCERCTGAGPTQGHHADYARPWDVCWLCAACHGAEHARLRAAGGAPVRTARLPHSYWARRRGPQQHHCSVCGSTRHNRRTCSERGASC